MIFQQTASNDPEPTEARVAGIIASGVFDVAFYRLQTGIALDVGIGDCVADYLLRGERLNLLPNDFFVPRFVRSQFEVLGIPVIEDCILLTYLKNPNASIDPHPLFDHSYFARNNQQITHLEDYLSRRQAGAMPPSPHILFDREYYYERNADVAARKIDALLHYVRSGWREGRQPHPLFHSDYWMNSRVDSGEQVGGEGPLSEYCSNRNTWSAGTHPLFDPEHFLAQLKAQGLEPSSKYPPLADMLLRDVEISGHALFDTAFYRMQAQRLGIELQDNALVHYVKNRGRGNLEPHPLFCADYYMDGYVELQNLAVSPLEHFITEGQERGRDPNPLFSQDYYRKVNPEVPRGERRPLQHYLARGRDLLNPHPLFEARVYAARHPDCLQRGDTPLSHYFRSWAVHDVRFPPWGTALYPRRQAPRDFRPPDVLLISHELTRTGAPAILLRIVQDLVRRRGLRTLVLAGVGGELLEEFSEWTATIDLSQALRAGIREAAFLGRIRASFGADNAPRLVIVNTACIGHLGQYFAGQAPVVALIHELASAFPAETFPIIYKNSDLIVYPAEFVRSEAHLRIPLPAEKAAVIPQGLLNPDFGRADPQRARESLLEEIGAPADAFIVFGCGTVDLRKGLDMFVLTALATLRAAEERSCTRPTHFVWAGGGPVNRQSVDWFAHQDIDRAGVVDRVHLLGPRAGTESYFLACDTFVVTSRMDPFPCVVHEAMACAKPVIAFANAGGAAEALADGAGIIIRYGDIAAMAGEILRLQLEPDRARQIGARARDIVHRRYVFTDYVDKILARVRETTGTVFAEPARPQRSAPYGRHRVIVACGGCEPDQARRFEELLVAGLLDRGFDAELLFTNDLFAQTLPEHLPAVPYRFLARTSQRPTTYKERWDALTCILGAAEPVVLIPNLDLIAAAIVPTVSARVGVLEMIHGGGRNELEQAARLGRYWQRAVVSRPSIMEQLQELVPSLRDRIIHIPRPVTRFAAPERRTDAAPLGIISVGRQPPADSVMPFLLPLVRRLQADGVNFRLTAISAGGEGKLLMTALSREIIEGTVHVIEGPTGAEIDALLPANDVMLSLSGDNGRGIRIAEAMSAGLAVVAIAQESDEFPVEGEHGYRITSARADLCALRLRQLAEDRSLLERLRRAAYETLVGASDAADVSYAYARVLGDMFDELQSGLYRRPKPLYVHPVFGALSLPPMFQLEPDRLGFPKPLESQNAKQD